MVVAVGSHSSRVSHRDGRDEEVPGQESAQPQDKEADPDQVVAVGISKKVTPRTQLLGRPSRLPGSPLRRLDYSPHHPGSGSQGRWLMGIVVSSGLLRALRSAQRKLAQGLRCPRPPGSAYAPQSVPNSPVLRGVSSSHGRPAECAWVGERWGAAPAPASGGGPGDAEGRVSPAVGGGVVRSP